MTYTFRTFTTLGITHPASSFINDDVEDDEPQPMVMLHHGNQETALSWETPDNPSYPALRNAMLTEGWRLCAADAALNNWGNEPGLEAYRELWGYMTTHYNVTKILHIGVSMGGLSALLTAAGGVVPADGIVLIAPVCNLRQVWDVPGGLAAGIEAAYDIDPPGDVDSYETQTEGHDPFLFDPSTWADIPMRFYASLTDGTINQDSNAFAMSAKVRRQSRREYELRACTDDHTSPQQFQPSDVVQFFGRCIAGAPHRNRTVIGTDRGLM